MSIIKVLASIAFLAFCFTHRSSKTVYPCVEECGSYVEEDGDMCRGCYARYSIRENGSLD